MDPQYLNLFDLFCQEPVQNPGHKMAAGPTVIAKALTASSNYTANNPPRMQEQRLLVQF